jgi:chromate transporter
LGRSALRTRGLALLALLAIGAVVAGIHELIVLAGSGVLMGGLRVLSGSNRRATTALVVAGASAAPGAATLVAASTAGGTVAAPFALWPLFLVFAKVGAVLFGSGYVLLAFLRADLVQRLGWLTEQQLLDATAVGQVTPGPVFTTATFIGYILGGPAGAGVATLGIFLPAFVFVALSGPLVPRLRRSAVAGGALDGVNVASLALMTVVSWQLGRAALVDPVTVALAVGSVVALVRYRVNSAGLIAAGGAVGWLATHA